jgi:hypothetical protein
MTNTFGFCGYYAQDHSADFEEDMSVLDWMAQFKKY